MAMSVRNVSSSTVFHPLTVEKDPRVQFINHSFKRRYNDIKYSNISRLAKRSRSLNQVGGASQRPGTGQPPMVEEKRSGPSKKVWIIGSSYIRRGEEAAQRLYGSNLGLKATVCWFGKGGMRWDGVLPRFYAEASIQSPPDLLVIHAGGNNLGITSAKTLATTINYDLVRLHKEFPAMKILFSAVNERRRWRYGEIPQIIRDRHTVNDFMRDTAWSFNGQIVEHPLLRHYKRPFFIADGVHFSEEGNRVFLGSIRSSLQRILEENKKPRIFWP